MDPLLTPIKGRSRALVREGWPRGRTGRRIRLSLSLSPTRTLVTPYCKRIHPPWAQYNTKAAGSPYCSPPFVSRLAPTHLGWDTQRQFTRRSRAPRGRNADSWRPHHHAVLPPRRDACPSRQRVLRAPPISQQRVRQTLFPTAVPPSPPTGDYALPPSPQRPPDPAWHTPEIAFFPTGSGLAHTRDHALPPFPTVATRSSMAHARSDMAHP
jgi:hypothetical protein